MESYKEWGKRVQGMSALKQYIHGKQCHGEFGGKIQAI
jgi:hypothetical protein